MKKKNCRFSASFIFSIFHLQTSIKMSSGNRGMICAMCEKLEPAGQPFLKCGACKVKSYCSKSCQVSHWPVHKVSSQFPNLRSVAQEVWKSDMKSISCLLFPIFLDDSKYGGWGKL
jgi:hypothetical protein